MSDKKKFETQTLRLEAGFQAQPKNLYEALTDERLVSTYTQSPAKIDSKEGGQFSLFGGSIQGKFVKLEPYSRIVEHWRFVDWPDGHYSTVTIELSAPSSNTCRLHLVQTDVPENDKFGNADVPDKVKHGWENYFWERIQKVLGYHKVN